MLAAGVAGAASQAMPACGKGANPNSSLRPNCFIRSFVADTYSAPLTGSVTVKKIATRNKGALVDVTIAVTAGSEVTRVCSNPQPIADLPCRDASLRIGINWKYVPGAKTLTPAGFGIGDSTPCPTTTGPCVRHFTIPAYSTYGTVVPVVQVQLGYITKSPVNNLGFAGFEIPIAVAVKRFRPA